MSRKKQIEQELHTLDKKVLAAGKRYDESHPDARFDGFICEGVGRISTCTNTAVYLAARLNGDVYGYYTEDNPTARMGESEGGHDFTVIDDRWLLDYWAYDMFKLPWMYDLEDPDEAAAAGELYGDREAWTKLPKEDLKAATIFVQESEEPY